MTETGDTMRLGTEKGFYWDMRIVQTTTDGSWSKSIISHKRMFVPVGNSPVVEIPVGSDHAQCRMVLTEKTKLGDAIESVNLNINIERA